MRIVALLVPVALTGLLAAGCAQKESPANPTTPATTAPADNGVKDLAVNEILKKATDAAKAAGSYRVKGEVAQEGTKITLDIKTKGNDVSGTLGMPQGAIKILRVGSETYFQADAAFWKLVLGPQGETIGALLKDKWVKNSKDPKQLAEFGSFADLGDLEGLLKHDGTVTKGEVSTLNGASVIALKSGGADGEATLFVATTGQPYPLRLQGPVGEGQIDFSEFGATFDDIKAPPADQVVDLGSFTGK